jgi:hypothetical protein
MFSSPRLSVATVRQSSAQSQQPSLACGGLRGGQAAREVGVAPDGPAGAIDAVGAEPGGSAPLHPAASGESPGLRDRARADRPGTRARTTHKDHGTSCTNTQAVGRASHRDPASPRATSNTQGRCARTHVATGPPAAGPRASARRAAVRRRARSRLSSGGRAYCRRGGSRFSFLADRVCRHDRRFDGSKGQVAATATARSREANPIA